MSDQNRQAGASGKTEIEIIRTEITDAMVLAGVGELAARRDAGVTDSDLVCGIYAAMRRAEVRF